MKPPFKVLFSNDTVNTVSCISPYHAKGEPFSKEILEASVDETADTGVDVHMLQPGLMMVPWWHSQQYPYAEHIAWYQATYGAKVDDNPYYAYMMDGGDMVRVFVDRCHAKGIVPFVSVRLNDSHGKEFVNTVGGGEIEEIPGYALHCVNRFYKEHPEYRIDPVRVGKDDWNVRVLNWANPEVVEWMFGFIRELCENYDIGGLELDFMRHSNYFRPEETTFVQRAEIMTDFVGRVRALLDRTSAAGQHRWLAARLPCFAAAFDDLGIDLGAMAAAGLEIVNLSHHYHTAQQTDLGLIRRMVPADVAVVLELTHSVVNVDKVPGKYDAAVFLRTTDEQLQTAAHLAYARGADGISAFNFAYYREFGAAGRGPFNEPPFALFERLRDPAWLARQPQHYYLASTASWANRFGRKAQLPLNLSAGQRGTVELDLAPPTGGWQSGGRLRLRAREAMGEARFQVRFNGAELVPTDDLTELYPTRYAAAHHPVPQKMRAWMMDAGVPRDGVNLIEIVCVEGDRPVLIEVVDFSLA